MPDIALFYVAAAQVALTFAVMAVMFFRRRAAVKAGQFHLRDHAVRGARWPLPAQQAADNFQNQFELPMLFYAACLFALHFQSASWPFVILAVVFVVFRFVHAVIHLTSNRIIVRALALGVSALALLLMWLALGVRLAGL
jgi:hypothetical protein